MTDTLKAAEARYLQAFDALLYEAKENQHMAALVDALTGTLARIAVGYGTPNVAGDILARLGRAMVGYAERQRAQGDASRVRDTKAMH
jgi:hypothetical protein